MPEQLETINDINFEEEVLGSQLPFLLEFSATWCSPCRALEPILRELASDLRGQVRIGKIDLEDAPTVAARLGVRGAPTIVVFHQGIEAGRQLGLTHKRALLELALAATTAPASGANNP